MNFILMTLSVMLGFILASILMVVIMLICMSSALIRNWYVKAIMKMVTNIEGTVDEIDEYEEDL